MGLFTSLLCIILFAVFILIALKAAPFGSEDNDGLHLAKDRKKKIAAVLYMDINRRS